MALIANMRRKAMLACAACLLVVHAALLAMSAARYSPVRDEVGHLPAGISHWRFGSFELYRVNPPLVRMVGALPAMLLGCNTDWHAFDRELHKRCEYGLGRDFVAANGDEAFWLYTLGRWACIPFSLLGAIIVFVWARDLFGDRAGFVAMSLWCFSPDILGHGSLMMPDAAAAATGAAASYAFWRWLRSPRWRGAILAGLFLGLALLTKLTWVFMLALLPGVWVCWRLRALWQSDARVVVPLPQLVGVLGVGLLCLNAGYGFHGALPVLGEMQFVSRALGGGDAVVQGTGNRFAGTILQDFPLPVPREYLQGIDIQRRDFEIAHWSYLAGEWRFGGQWGYYLYALAVKSPAGLWLLIAISLAFALARFRTLAWSPDSLVLLAPAVLVIALVSSQTAMNLHYRYVLPALPFLLIWASQAARHITGLRSITSFAVAASLVWYVASSLAAFPHSLSYFNELAGGIDGGPKHLAGSAVDWGQDLAELAKWARAHPSCRPLLVACDSPIDASAICRQLLPHPNLAAPTPPGWYAVSTNYLFERSGEFRGFRNLQPETRVGGSIRIYRIAPTQQRTRAVRVAFPLLDPAAVRIAEN